jgi:acetyl esterase
MSVDPQIASLLEQLNANGVGPMSSRPLAEVRDLFAQMLGGISFMEAPTTVAVEEIEIPGDAGPIAARVYRPEGEAARPTVVFFHGGGFVIGDVPSYEGQCRAIAAGVDAVVVSVEYRRAPETPFPGAVDDALAATRWVAGRLEGLGGRSDRLAVAGDSAGGNLSAVVAQQLRGSDVSIAAQLLLYPVTDFESERPSHRENADGYFLTLDDMYWFRDQYVPNEADRRDPRVAPGTASDLSGLPPAVVATAGYDPLRDDGDAYAEALAAAGVSVRHLQNPTLIHGFLAMAPLSPAAQEARDAALAAFRELLA